MTEIATVPAELPRDVIVKVESWGATIIARCAQLPVIDSQDRLEEANQVIQDAKKIETQIKAEIEPLKTLQYRAYKATSELLNKQLSFVDEVKNLSGRAARYIADQRAKAEEERRRLEAEARAEAERKAQEERDALLAAAAEMESKGMTKAAERTLAEAERVEAAPIVTQKPDLPPPAAVSGLTVRDNWKARLVDLSQVPRDYLCFDQKAADAFARATKGTKQIPGVEIYNDPVPVRR